MAATIAEPTKTEAQLKLEEKAKDVEEAEREKARIDAEIAKLSLPEDLSARFSVRQLQISGNSLIATDELLKDVPAVYNASDKALDEAESKDLFDLRVLQDIIAQPGEPREVSTRTIQGFTQYLLSVYQAKNYAGIYVYVPAGAVVAGTRLQDEVLPIRILEASVNSVTATHYNPENEKVEEGYLRDSAVYEWSPVEIGETANQKELDDFVNLLNLNPDRYVSAVISRGTEPNSLALGYNIYEANPWHWFIQVDNAGSKARRWSPRFGLINTNLTGIDDTFMALYQAPMDSGWSENYSLYGSYDFPVMGPRLRLNLYGGYSEFDTSPDTTAGFNFRGDGSFAGGELRLNVCQKDGWFFDITSSMGYEKSKVAQSLFGFSFPVTTIEMHPWGIGADIHRRDDMSNTSLTFDRFQNMGGSSASQFNIARTNATDDFVIYTATAAHSQYLDADKVERISGSFRWIYPEDRLVPAKMTTFGGLYSVRGYEEDEIVADGGILASIQYEFDTVAFNKSETDETESGQVNGEKPFLRKLAPLVFADYGQARVKAPISTEQKYEELLSVGAGILVELGDNFSGGVYYGHPLERTSNTSVGCGNLSVTLMLRW
jgi:hemolysin activation/secretion protein